MQDATFDCGLITQANGGYLKPLKCFSYMMSWKWVNGEQHLELLSELPRIELEIPQKDEFPVETPLKEIVCSEKTLGVYFW